MSLDIYFYNEKDEYLGSNNVTHNLSTMAGVVGLYKCLWYPEKLKITRAKELLPRLVSGLSKLIYCKDECKIHDSNDGWGNYETFVRFVTEIIAFCVENPNAIIKVSR